MLILLREFYNEDSDLDFINQEVIERSIDKYLEELDSFLEIFEQIYSV